jgi:hypothetical protein
MRLTKTILSLTAVIAVALPGTALAKGPKPKLQFSQAAYAVAENGGSATITVLRNGNAKRVNQTASVDFATSNGTAVAGTDYSETHGTLNFASGETSKTFTVSVNDKDSVDTGPRTINLKLSHATGANGAILGYPSTATLVISDDDAASGGGGGIVPPTFQVAAAEEIVGEPNGAQAYNLYVIRSGDLSTAATISYATADGTAVAGTDYTAVPSTTKTFPKQADDATASIIQVVPVTLLHNASATPPTRSFSFNLSVPSGSSSTLGTPASETVTIVNRDGTPTLQFSAPSYSVAENGGSVRLTVFAAGNISSDLEVGYSTADGSALAGVNYTAQNDTLQFVAGDGDIAESFDVPVMSDGQLGDKFFTATHDGSTLVGGAVGTPATSTVTVLNTDDAPAQAPVNGDGKTGDGTTVVNTTTTVVNSATDNGQSVLGARQAACGLTVKVSKKQRLLRSKVLRMTLKTGERCKVSLATTIKQVKSSKKKAARSAKALRFKGKKASLTLLPQKAKTVKVKFTKKTLKAIKKALQARKKLVATVVVTTKDSASKTSRKTLKITIRR